MDHRKTIGAVFLLLFVLVEQTPPTQANQIYGIIDSLKAQFLPKEYRNINLTLDDVKKVVRSKCEKVNSNQNAQFFDEIEAAATQSLDCISRTANITAMQEEIEAARPMGELDSVFHNYCLKVPELENCIQNLTVKAKYCLSENERMQSAVLGRILKNLVSFLCMKGGDQIALFVAEQGPECLEANKEPLGHCLNATLGEFMPNNSSDESKKIDLNNLSELIISPKHCADLEHFEACAIHHLEQCEEITPANVAESIFRFIKSETNCTNWKASQTTEKSILKKSANKSNSAALVHISRFLALLSSTFILIFAYNI